MDEFKRLDRELIFKGSIIDYYKDTIQVPNGNVVKWDFIQHNGAAAIVPVMDDGKILMVRQYRNALDRYALEIPAGGLKSIEEPTKTAAARELEEETGYRSEQVEWLMSLRTSLAYSNEKIEIYTAHNLIPSKQNLDEDEFINLEAYTVEELIDMIFAGTLQDAKSIAAILAYKEKYLQQK